MDSISVLFFLSNLKGGGAERVLLNLLSGFQKTTVKPALYLIKNQVDYVDELEKLSTSINVVYATQQGERIRNKLPEIWGKSKGLVNKSDVLVGALELDPTYFAFFWAKRFQKPIIGWVHTPIQPYLLSQPRKHSLFVKYIYPRLNRIIFPSWGAAESMTQYLHLPANKIRIIPNPIDINLVESLADEPLPEKYAHLTEKPIILAIGRLEYQKGFDLLLQASAILISRGYAHNLVILGEGDQRPSLQTMALQLNISDSFFLPGFIPNPYPFIKNAKIFVSSSRTEGFGQTILEALSLGVPVVATNCNTGPAEILDGGNFGILTTPEDVDALANSIERLFLTELHDRYSRLGLERALEYSPIHIADLWKDLFFEIIDNK
jgi:glycosyltransferase involved in cell wall biosynthesis